MYSKYLFQNFQKTFAFLKEFLKKCFYRNDTSSLNLTVSFSVGGFKTNCWGLQLSLLIFKKFKNTKLKKHLSTVALVCFLLIVLVFVCWMNLISYITAGNLIKTKIYIFIYVLWNTYLLSSFSSLFFFTLPLIRQWFFLLFFCFFFF